VDRANISQLLTETGSAALLSGTRSVEVTLTMIRAAGSYNDGYADNISVHLTGLTRGQVLVDGTQDFSSETIAKSTGISFLAGAPAIATFTTAQFGTDLIASAARVEGSSDTDTLTISLAPNDIFSAQTFSFQNWTNGADVLVFTGANGAENLTGSNRADRVAMGAGDDRVAGQAGDDVLDGGAGRDRLRGGGGGDSFVLTDRQNSRDILQDFASGTDLLIVEADSFAAGLTAGALQGDQFVANATGQFTTADQRFAYDTTTGKLWFDLDGSDAAIAVQIATLSGAPTLLVTDFLIV
jgi:Ca2+-binding RTX toxin-like protein